MLVFVNLYKCYARLLLEYCSIIFSPHHVYLINLIEIVQKNLPKNCLDCEMCYQDSLKLYNLESLETRRLHADLILMHKIISGTIHVDLHNTMPNLIFENIFLSLELLIFGTFYIMTFLAVELLLVLL